VLLKKRQISQIGEEGRLLSTTVFRWLMQSGTVFNRLWNLWFEIRNSGWTAWTPATPLLDVLLNFL